MQRFLISTFLLLLACSESVSGDVSTADVPGLDVPPLDAGRMGEDVSTADVPGLDVPPSDVGLDVSLMFDSCAISVGSWIGVMTVDPASTEPLDTCPNGWTAMRWFNTLESATEGACAGLSSCSCTPMPGMPPGCASSRTAICPPGDPTGVTEARIEARKVSATEIFYRVRRESVRGSCIWTSTLRYTP